MGNLEIQDDLDIKRACIFCFKLHHRDEVVVSDRREQLDA